MSGLMQVITVLCIPGFAEYSCVGTVLKHSVYKEVLDVHEIGNRPQIFLTLKSLWRIQILSDKEKRWHL